MRILTETQYDAICDIVTDLQKENEELKAKIAKKDNTIEYLNDKLFNRTEKLMQLQSYCRKAGFYIPVDPKTQLVEFPNSACMNH